VTRTRAKRMVDLTTVTLRRVTPSTGEKSCRHVRIEAPHHRPAFIGRHYSRDPKQDAVWAVHVLRCVNVRSRWIVLGKGKTMLAALRAALRSPRAYYIAKKEGP